MSLVDKLVRDKHGKVVIWQTPNIPLSIWLGTSIISHFTQFHKTWLLFTADSFLITWAYLEIKDGTSMFRRALGLAVIIAILVGHFK